MYIRQECLVSFDEIIKYQPKTRLELILSQLDFSNILNELSLLFSFIVMQVEQLKTIKKLAERLQNDPVFRYTCGFNVLQKPPSLSTLSRFLTKLFNCKGLEKDFETLVVKAKKLNIIDGTDVAIDSTCIHSYEKAKPKSKLIENSNGKVTHWFGYKLHITKEGKK